MAAELRCSVQLCRAHVKSGGSWLYNLPTGQPDYGIDEMR